VIAPYRKNQQRSLDTIQISLEAEARGRLEALRQRKKLEQDVLELEAALEATARARGEVEKNYKRFQQQIRDLELVVEEEQAAAQVGHVWCFEVKCTQWTDGYMQNMQNIHVICNYYDVHYPCARH